ncbi:hypothetical protein MPH47_09735 [Psychrobacillus psychrodurans]|uniref:hypothetical protein n=1 Tax=Psychrobacillus psychrodurans TaxID=126157 RepID=UPI001F4E933C|nr:hypothetical protein [Psychrobacillus psychrodurans]MCK1997497.1 hypothetical protein [Psychrobacillus psychrodurans]
MKIEVGESLMLSWLRHVKKCQSVQLNWKPSINHWELSNESEIEQIIKTVNTYFEKKYSLNIFKNNKSYMQLLQQGELDALGLQIQNGVVQEIYGVDVAFHEAGLNYGSKIETVERVIKKIVRTSLLLYGYFNMKKGTIIFASPKINQAIYEPLHSYIEELKNLYSSMGFNFEIEITANESFKNQILEPLISLSSSVADTSELFLRSIQMYNMFLASNNVSAIGHKTFIKANTIESTSGSYKLPIAVFVRDTFTDLINQNKLSMEKIYHLCDYRYSKETFLLPYPMLKKVTDETGVSIQRKINGRDRYYANPIKIHEEKYLLCNHWIEVSRKPYKFWLENLINK